MARRRKAAAPWRALVFTAAAAAVLAASQVGGGANAAPAVEPAGAHELVDVNRAAAGTIAYSAVR